MFSYGSLPRGLLISAVAILFFFCKKKFTNMNDYQIFIYSWFSILIIILLPFSFLLLFLWIDYYFISIP